MKRILKAPQRFKDSVHTSRTRKDTKFWAAERTLRTGATTHSSCPDDHKGLDASIGLEDLQSGSLSRSYHFATRYLPEAGR